ncbi:unnamed protein product [Phytophthora fragariaefolia]|uniref:Unnamed protein product n=1 Tax=Phytophthora fragariaefolia TaxID=1490495 RepID=A0A9W7D6V5_9STRA|nr:unnamed protein product [Phytophthora fragariaefolia]
MRLHPTFYVGRLKPYAQHESPSLGDSAPTPARARGRAFTRQPASAQGRPARPRRSARPARAGPSTRPAPASTQQTRPSSGGVQQPPDDQRSLVDQTCGVFPPPPPPLRDEQGKIRWIIQRIVDHRIRWASRASAAMTGQLGVSERDINGYTGVRVPEELKTLRTNLIAQMSSSAAAGGLSTLPRAVGDYSSRSSFTPFGGFGGGGLRFPSPFPERRASGRSAAPTYRGSEEILSNEYENDSGPRSGSDDRQFAG